MTDHALAVAPVGETHGTLLGGRVSYTQKQNGYRTGIEPVLLAAFVPAAPGDIVVEGGAGAGAGLLCLAARVAGVTGIGLEVDPALAELANRNLAANAYEPWPVGLSVRTQDVTRWQADGPFDHAFANPPWHRADGTPSPFAGRQLAKAAGEAALAAWAAHLAAGLRPRGTLSLVLPAAALGEGVAALRGARCQEIDILPLWVRAGQCARFVILRGVRDGGGAGRLLPGLILHGEEGRYTEAVEDVLRRGAAIVS